MKNTIIIFASFIILNITMVSCCKKKEIPKDSLYERIKVEQETKKELYDSFVSIKCKSC